MVAHVQAILTMQERGAVAFDYGNNLRAQAKIGGLERAFGYPGFVPAFIRDSFCEGRGPFRWCALSGDPADIAATDKALLELFPDDHRLQEWLGWAGEKIAFQGLPARICWLGYKERDKAGLLFNQLVRDGTVSAPLVIGRDHLDAGSVASPYRETEAMKDTSDAVSDWPLLNFAVGASSGAAWVSFHHGGGVGMGYSQHAGLVAVADGTDEAERRLGMCLVNDPAMGVIRHADAGYDKALDVARTRGWICRRSTESEYIEGTNGASGEDPLRAARLGSSPESPSVPSAPASWRPSAAVSVHTSPRAAGRPRHTARRADSRDRNRATASVRAAACWRPSGRTDR